jgi:hypothetical protein
MNLTLIWTITSAIVIAGAWVANKLIKIMKAYDTDMLTSNALIEERRRIHDLEVLAIQKDISEIRKESNRMFVDHEKLIMLNKKNMAERITKLERNNDKVLTELAKSIKELNNTMTDMRTEFRVHQASHHNKGN